MLTIPNFSRRSLMKWGLISAGASLVPRARGAFARAQVGGRSEGNLFPGKNLPGGGQLDIRMIQSPENPDPDIIEVARRMRPYDPDSWYNERKRVGELNEEVAEKMAAEGHKQTAAGFYDRAVRFYAQAGNYLPESDDRMMPMYHKILEVCNKSWKQVKPDFDQVEIPWEGGKTLTAYFRKPAGRPGTLFPAVFAHGGADGLSEAANARNGGALNLARGMANISVEGPGQMGSLRAKGLHQPVDSERFAKAVVDYLVSRPDVDPGRIGITGGSMGGYGAPRCATGEHRFKAVAVWSGSFSLQSDIFDYYPPIQERLRWIIGARDLADARKKIAEYTMEGIADRIECPMLIGYSKDDRIMDPAGALRLYKAATRSQREMVGGTGHDFGVGGPVANRVPRDVILADFMAKHLVEPSA
jgi:dienelactone hydrolase